MVTVESQSSSPSSSTTSYPPPSLVSVSGVGARDADTFGGQVVTLLGADFGPLVNSQSWSIVATYGLVRSPPLNIFSSILCVYTDYYRYDTVLPVC